MSSFVWKYFEKTDNEHSICKICKKKMKSSGNTSNLRKHLKSCHYAITLETNAAENSVDELSPTMRRKPNEITSFDQVKAETEVTLRASLANLMLCELEANKSKEKDGRRNKEITNAILYFICADYMPLQTVQTRGFSKLIKTVAPTYEVPSEGHLKMILTNKYDVLKNALKLKFQYVDWFSATCDIWTETTSMTSYLGVTMHYLEGNQLKCAYIATIFLDERHTAGYISRKLTEELNVWGIDTAKVKTIITGNGTNITAAIRHFFRNDSSKNIRCFAQTINLIADSLFKGKELTVCIEKVRNIVKYFKMSVKAYDDLMAIQNTNTPKELILDVKTKWNSSFYMIEKFIEIASAVSTILYKDLHAPPMLSVGELNHLTEIISLFKPLEFVTTDVSDEQNVTISKVIPSINCLITQIAKIELTSPVCIKTKDLLQQEILRRFNLIEKNLLISVPTVLDPRFKNLHFRDAKACTSTLNYIRKTISDQFQTISSASNTDKSVTGKYDFWQKHKDLARDERISKSRDGNDELSLFMKYPVTPLTSNPLETWEDLKETFPKLYQLFRSHAMIVASSVPAERLFAKIGATATEINQLEPKIVNELLFLAGRPENEWF